MKKDGKKGLFMAFQINQWGNIVGVFEEKMYFKGEVFYGKSCFDNSNPRFGYHGNAGNSHGMDRAV
ncbi:hypothetical protein [Fibrobacter sp.]|uniref:hypothetical protein n=1 Tax=Fibrobacter sp. TaxID=35828 RepID=UPI003869B3CA